MKNITSWNLSLQVLLFAGVVLAIPLLLGLILPIVKPKIKRKSNIYLYSFSAGFILVLGLYGLIAQPLTSLRETLEGGGHLHDHDHHNQILKTYGEWETIGILAGIAIGGVTIGMGGSMLARHIFTKKSGEVHSNHGDHNHGDHIFNLKEAQSAKSKLTVVMLLMAHKIPAGISLGLMIQGLSHHASGMTIAAIVAFIIHTIPEMLTIYYRQIEMGTSKWKAMGFTLLIQLILLPMMFIGAYLGEAIQDVVWLMPLILVTSGSILVFTAILELIPEFIDQQISHVKWHTTTLLFVVGFLFALLILLVHVH
ncbi:hypothetical protein [Mycoplasma todarodis]|uniref:ZIP family metal transporter n=1 Tax=Mycoplasma todarodis TaxID=1937191 RepID=A0A4R0XTB9_9MOLU|nr:hypothetical protein [Mycoplasma todarodis]TCG10997.1 hypothetical protein C4B25_02545 [Mycoplasma todarodis]